MISNLSPSERFEVVRRLDVCGANNSGIFLVNDKLTNKQAILKCLPRFNGTRSAREAGKMARLAGHPSIVKMLVFVPATASSTKSSSLLPSSSPNQTVENAWDQIYMALCITQVGIHTFHTLKDVLTLYGSQPLPEGFIWEVLKGIAKALCFLQFGVHDVMLDSPDPDWEPILHRDLHSGNILLSTSSVSDHPRVLLGDFGIALTLTEIREELESTPEEILPSGVTNLAQWKAQFTSDAENLGGLMYALCHADMTGEEWDNGKRLGGASWNPVLSEELRQVVEPLNWMGDMDVELVDYARHVVCSKAEMLQSGRLVFQAL